MVQAIFSVKSVMAFHTTQRIFRLGSSFFSCAPYTLRSSLEQTRAPIWSLREVKDPDLIGSGMQDR